MTEEPDSTAPENAAVSAPEYLIVGQVVAPFGVKGELKVNILTEFPERFNNMEQVTLAPFASIAPGLAPTAALNPKTVRNPAPLAALPDGTRAPRWKPPGEATPFQIETTHIHKGQLLLKLEGVDDANQAEALRGYWLVVPMAQARKLPRGAHYIYEIIGLDVYTSSGDLIGKIADVLTTSANDVYIVKGPGVQDSSGELLVPAIKSVVHRIELKHGRVIIADPKEWT